MGMNRRDKGNGQKVKIVSQFPEAQARSMTSSASSTREGWILTRPSLANKKRVNPRIRVSQGRRNPPHGIGCWTPFNRKRSTTYWRPFPGLGEGLSHQEKTTLKGNGLAVCRNKWGHEGRGRPAGETSEKTEAGPPENTGPQKAEKSNSP